ncbi:MAG TPA: hypothetical protein PLR37_00715, partial [Candidatus Accumulibacter phosphatis]|nr:hypothetical protein [Candidatus Accumulibacter phosphatis]
MTEESWAFAGRSVLGEPLRPALPSQGVCIPSGNALTALPFLLAAFSPCFGRNGDIFDPVLCAALCG